MVQIELIALPTGIDDVTGARRSFSDFFSIYCNMFVAIEGHLEKIVENTESTYATAYRPWHKAAHDLFQGVYLISKNIPLPKSLEFIDALRTFSFEGAIQLLQDICLSCKIAIPPNWVQNFKKHIDTLLFAFSILQRSQQQQLER